MLPTTNIKYTSFFINDTMSKRNKKSLHRKHFRSPSTISVLPFPNYTCYRHIYRHQNPSFPSKLKLLSRNLHTKLQLSTHFHLNKKSILTQPTTNPSYRLGNIVKTTTTTRLPNKTEIKHTLFPCNT